MFEMRDSVAARLVCNFGLLTLVSLIAMSSVFHFGTVGVIDRNIDSDIANQAQRIAPRLASATAHELAAEVKHKLSDGIDSDREIYLVVAEDGARLAGNIARWPEQKLLPGRIIDATVLRDSVPTEVRVVAFHLRHGGYYLFGDDLRELSAMQQMVWRALAVGVLLSLGLAAIGALLFRRQIARRIAEVRRTARIIGAGNLSERIQTVSADEFGELNDDINHMLDRIEQLMTSVRDVSNAIAHDLRTPLTRVRAKLEGAYRRVESVEEFQEIALDTMSDIDDLIQVFQCLLQIAEAEAGVGTAGFRPIDLAEVAGDLTEMYESTAEGLGVTLRAELSQAVVRGDRDLIATAVASLIENGIKYADQGGYIEVIVVVRGATAALIVRDYGPGIPSEHLPRVTERFYRADQSRSLPGNGLGLAIVAAIVELHRGLLTLSNANPGLHAAMEFPLEAKPQLPPLNG